MIEENLFRFLMIFSTFIIFSALILILMTIAINGISSLNFAMLTQTPKGGFYLGKEGGILNAILGSVFLTLGSVFLSTIVCIPIVLYLNIYMKRNSIFMVEQNGRIFLLKEYGCTMVQMCIFPTQMTMLVLVLMLL